MTMFSLEICRQNAADRLGFVCPGLGVLRFILLKREEGEVQESVGKFGIEFDRAPEFPVRRYQVVAGDGVESSQINVNVRPGRS